MNRQPFYKAIDYLFDGKKGKEYPVSSEKENIVQPENQVKLYNHLEIANEYKEYCKGKKRFEIQSFHIWLVETYPDMLFIKRN